MLSAACPGVPVACPGVPVAKHLAEWRGYWRLPAKMLRSAQHDKLTFSRGENEEHRPRVRLSQPVCSWGSQRAYDETTAPSAARRRKV